MTENTKQKILGMRKSLKGPQRSDAMSNVKTTRFEYRRREKTALEILAQGEDGCSEHMPTIGNTLEQLFARFCSFECSDTRDKVYALIGLATNRPISADYQRPRAAVFWELNCLKTAGEQFQLIHFNPFKLTVRELRTLFICTAGTSQLRTNANEIHGWLRNANGAYETTYDEELMNWFHWSRSENTQLVEIVESEESEMMKLFRSGLNLDAEGQRSYMIVSFLKGMRTYHEQTDCGLI